MYELTITTTFSSAHNLRGYEGACERLHGHNWKVEVSVTSDRLDHLGMVMDFKKLKAEIAKLIETIDHRYLNEVVPFDSENPSAENIASFLFKELSTVVNDNNKRISRVRVWESETAAAAYSG